MAFEITIRNCVIGRVFVSQKPPHRVYLDVVDLDAPGGGVFSFGAEGIDFQAAMADKGKIGTLRGKFEMYLFDGVQKWKGSDIRFSPDVLVNGVDGHNLLPTPGLDEMPVEAKKK